MADPQHIEWLGQGILEWNQQRARTPFRPDFSSADLTAILRGPANDPPASTGASLKDADLRGADMREARLHGLDLTGADLSQADLTGADLSSSTLRATIFFNARLEGANLRYTEAPKAAFIDANLERADLVGANLANCKFWGCNLGGAKFQRATVTDAEFPGSRPWTAHLYSPIADRTDDVPLDTGPVQGIGDLLIRCSSLRQMHDDNMTLYFRGESRSCWELRPSIMRARGRSDAVGRSVEAEMLNDLIRRQPDAFSGLTSAFMEWVFAQQHGLKTRLLDITRNPLVALYFACIDDCRVDGSVHVFVAHRSLVKPFNSQAVSIISNFAKLPRGHQNMLLGKDGQDVKEDMFQGVDWQHGSVPYAAARSHLYALIEKENPLPEEQRHLWDLFRVVIVEPPQMFDRLRAQSSAFLLSGFHERLEDIEVHNVNRNIPIYRHAKLSVPKEMKEELLDELRGVNITQESLFPGVPTSVKAVLREHLGEQRT